MERPVYLSFKQFISIKGTFERWVDTDAEKRKHCEQNIYLHFLAFDNHIQKCIDEQIAVDIT